MAEVSQNGLYHVRLTRLTGARLLGGLKGTASSNGSAPVREVTSEYLDQHLSDTFIDNDTKEFLLMEGASRKYVGTFSLKVAPRGDVLNGMDSLMSMPLSLRINTCWRSVSRREADKVLASARSFDEMRGLTPRKLFKAVAASRETGDLISADDTPRTDVGEVAEDYRQKVRRGEYLFGWMATSVLV